MYKAVLGKGVVPDKAILYRRDSMEIGIEAKSMNDAIRQAKEYARKHGFYIKRVELVGVK